jgi:hypothetical protein
MAERTGLEPDGWADLARCGTHALLQVNDLRLPPPLTRSKNPKKVYKKGLQAQLAVDISAITQADAFGSR